MNGQCKLGMIGLGVMGRNLLLNMADHNYTVAGYDRDLGKVALLRGGEPNIQAFDNIEDFIGALQQPRMVMMLVPAGSPVDAVISDLLPFLAPGDCIVDGGNSFFKDTDMRQRTLAARNIDFLGVGVSGGEEGARHGPSMMPGGPGKAWERIRPVFESIAANANGEPCVSYMGQGAAGHFVKMVHNGIEYGVMRLIADTYDFMKRGMGLDDDELGVVFDQWNNTEIGNPSLPALNTNAETSWNQKPMSVLPSLLRTSIGSGASKHSGFSISPFLRRCLARFPKCFPKPV